MTMQRSDIAAMIDHTLLKPEATREQVLALCAEAKEHGFAAACVSSIHGELVASALAGARALACCVVGFPSGAHPSAIKAAEAAHLADAGIAEVDMVIDLGGLIAEGPASVHVDVAAVRAALPADVILKVIIESAALSDSRIVEACRASVDAGADFVKTSTGFHPAGGATAHAVALMRSTVGPDVGVKASGGIRTLADLTTMVDAGADRIGASAGIAILAEAAAAEG
jgi:deoxyribose-phosphate aldolase